MSRTNIDFGIDLGTTNSAIAYVEKGEVRIVKSDGDGKDTTPSCVSFSRKKQIRAGDEAIKSYLREIAMQKEGGEPLNSFIEFKRTMGQDKKYFSPHMDQSYSSEELSAELLKKLKSYVKEDDVQAAVVTVPNQFKQNQIDATQRATMLAGLKHAELLQEPIAASLAFGLEAKHMKGFWVVFDFGGGTFDAALMKVDEGVMKVVDTDGDNHLGGKDVDAALVNQILIPSLKEKYAIDNLLADDTERAKLEPTLKSAAEALKIALSKADHAEWLPDEPVGTDDTGEEIDPEIRVTLKHFEAVAAPIFQRAIDKTHDLLARNNLKAGDIDAILLVGGPTLSQTLRRCLRDEFGDLVDTSADPMTSVARGAAIFASTKRMPIELQQRDQGITQLTLKYAATTVETEESLGVRIEKNQDEQSGPTALWIELSRSDGGWSSGKVKVEDAEIIDFQLIPGKTNTFEIRVTDELGSSVASHPSHFSVIQGLTVAKATLPYSICVESLLTSEGKQRLVLLEGLAKNTSLPAKGSGTFKTQKEIRPGNAADIVRIPLIQGNPGERAIYNQAACIVTCSGEDLSEFLPEGSEVELSVTIDTSRQITLSAYFPYIDDTYEKVVRAFHDTEQKEVNADMLRQEINKAQHALDLLDAPGAEQLVVQLEHLSERLATAGEDYDAKVYVFEQLQEVFKGIDKMESEAAWPHAEQRLDEAIEQLKRANEQYGDENSAAIVAQIEAKSNTIRQQQDLKLANSLIDEAGSVFFSLVRNETGMWIGYVKAFDDDFESQEWSDANAARKLIDQAKRVIATEPSRSKLEPIVFRLFDLLPDKDTPLVSDADRELLKK